MFIIYIYIYICLNVLQYLNVIQDVRCSSGGPGSEQEMERVPLELISLRILAMHVCMYACMCMCVYVYIYIYREREIHII